MKDIEKKGVRNDSKADKRNGKEIQHEEGGKYKYEGEKGKVVKDEDMKEIIQLKDETCACAKTGQMMRYVKYTVFL
jgi:hypothetical protein